MTPLEKLQQDFQQCVLHPQQPADTCWVSASGRADPDTQLSVYSYAYAARLTEVLASDYPAILMAIGDEQFNQLAAEYIQAHPSHYFSLRDFGDNFPGFISELPQQHALYAEWHWLFELAQFEWTLGQAFDAASTELFSEHEMAGVHPQQWPSLKFRLHPSVHCLDLEWNIAEMWQALTADEPVAVTASRDENSAWLIWREQLVTRYRSLPIDEQQALDCLHAGGSFNDMCAVLAGFMDEEEVPMRAAGLLRGWIGQGLISGLR